MEGKRRVKIYGPYRSGTNALSVYLQRAFPDTVQVCVNKPHSKHDKFKPGKYKGKLDQFAFLVMVKDPYAWVRSFGKHRGTSLTPNLVGKWCDWYNESYRSWLSIPAPTHIVEHNDLLEDHRQALAEIGEFLGLEPKQVEIGRAHV